MRTTQPRRQQQNDIMIMACDTSSDLTRAMAGDADALTRLLEQHGPEVRKTIRNRIPRQMQSVLSEDDVMQETYADVFLSFRNVDIRGSFPAWLQQIARNNLRDAIRCFRAERRGGQRRYATAERDEDGLSLLLDLVTDGGTTPSCGAMRHEWQDTLQRTLAELPDAYREVLRLYDLEFLDADQVGRRLGCSSGAVYMRRSRALAMLRGLLVSFSHYL